MTIKITCFRILGTFWRYCAVRELYLLIPVTMLLELSAFCQTPAMAGNIYLRSEQDRCLLLQGNLCWLQPYHEIS